MTSRAGWSRARLAVAARLTGLIAIVALGAYLRFTGLAWGARHPLHSDERVYVENVVAMLDSGDFDHRFYTYPGLFYYLLRGALSPLSIEARHSSDAYVLARAVVVCFGLLHIALLALVGARLFGVEAGLVAALLAAVSPVDVDTAHQVRPDVILQIFGLGAIVLLPRLGNRLRWDVGAGVLLGVAAAIKFTGVLLAPSYLLARLLAPGPRRRGVLVAGALAGLIVLACTPYALLHFAQYREGPGQQLRLYHVGDVPQAAVLQHAAFFLRAHVDTLGWAGALVALIGVAISLRAWRTWAPLLLYPVVNLAVMSTSSLVFARWILPAIDVTYLMAALAIASVLTLGKRTRASIAAALALVALVAMAPLRSSLGLARGYAAESAQDRAQDWILAHLDRGARILETRPAARLGVTPGAMVGVPPDRYEQVFLYTDERNELLSLLERHVDLVLLDPGHGWKGLTTVYRAPNASGQPAIILATAQQRPAYSLVSLMTSAVLTASSGDPVPALTDGDLSNRWTTPSPLRGSEWLRVSFASPVRVGRVQLVVPELPGTYDPEIALETAEGRGELQRVATVFLRPRLRDQNTALRPLSQDLLLKPRPIKTLRILQLGARPYPWAISELRVYERSKGEPQ